VSEEFVVEEFEVEVPAAASALLAAAGIALEPPPPLHAVRNGLETIRVAIAILEGTERTLARKLKLT
jgi:hypothetical protein